MKIKFLVDDEDFGICTVISADTFEEFQKELNIPSEALTDHEPPFRVKTVANMPNGPWEIRLPLVRVC